MNTIEYVWSTDNENFRYDSLKEILNNNDISIGQTVFVGKKLFVEPSMLIDSDDVIDIIWDRAYEIAGDYADTYIKERIEAKKKLDDFLENWIETYYPITFYEVDDIKEYVITEEDLNAN